MGFDPNDPTNQRQQGGPSYTVDNQYKGDAGFQNRNSFGGVVGGADQNVNRYRAMGGQDANRGAYQANYGGFNSSMGDAAGARGAQVDALGLQRTAAMGGAPSRAEILGHGMADDALAAQESMAAGATGGPAAQAAAQRVAMGNAGITMQRSANDIAGLRADEMARARDAYMGGATGIRSGDFTGAGLGLQKTGQDIQNEQFQRGLNQQGQQFNENLGFQTNVAQLGAAQGAQHEADATFAANQGVRQGDEDLSWDKLKTGVGAAAGAASGGLGLAASDAREKNDLAPLARSAPMGSLPPWMPPHTFPTVLLTSDVHAKQRARELGQRESFEAGHDAGVRYGYLPDEPDLGIPGVSAPARPDTHLAASNASEAAKIRAGFAPLPAQYDPSLGSMGDRAAAAAAARRSPMAPTPGMPAQAPPGALDRVGGAFGGVASAFNTPRYMPSDPDLKTELTPMAGSSPGFGMTVGGYKPALEYAQTNQLTKDAMAHPGSPGGAMQGGPLHISDPRAKTEAYELGLKQGAKDAYRYGMGRDVTTDPSRPELPPPARGFDPSRPDLAPGAAPRAAGVLGAAARGGVAGAAPPPPQAAPPAQMMDAIGPGKTFKYKPGVPDEDPNQQHFGTTTQDLRATPMGGSMVVTDPRTGYEAIDTREAVGPTLASLGNLNQRMRALEAEKPPRARRKE